MSSCRRLGPARTLVVVLVSIVALAAAACGSSGDGTADAPTDVVGDQPTPLKEVGDLVLTDYATDPAGEPFPMKAAEGELLVVYFGYLSCPDVCPLTMADNATGVSDLTAEEAERVEVAFVTVDLARDDGARIAEYLGHFFPDGGTHALRTDDDGALNKVTYGFGVVWEVAAHEPGEYYAVAHTGDTYVVDDQGHIVWRWPFGTTAAEVTTALSSLLASTYPTT
jgi:protein SCO1